MSSAPRGFPMWLFPCLGAVVCVAGGDCAPTCKAVGTTCELDGSKLYEHARSRSKTSHT